MLDDEIAFLKTEIFLRDAEPRLQTLTAFDRFSVVHRTFALQNRIRYAAIF